MRPEQYLGAASIGLRGKRPDVISVIWSYLCRLECHSLSPFQEKALLIRREGCAEPGC